MNLQTMKDRVYAVLQDTNRLYITDDEVEAWLNDAQMELVARLGEINSVEASGTVAVEDLPIPAGLIEIKQLELDGAPCQAVPSSEFEYWLDNAGSPPLTLFRVFGANIELYPAPTTSTAYRLRYTKEPTVLVNDGDTPEVPGHLHMKLVYWARAQARWKEGEAGLGDRDMAFFEDGLPSSAAGMARGRPGPISFRADLGTWADQDAEAAHL